MKNLVAVAMLTGIVVTAGAVFTASKSDDELLQRAKDREQIEELMWRYARARGYERRRDVRVFVYRGRPVLGRRQRHQGARCAEEHDLRYPAAAGRRAAGRTASADVSHDGEPSAPFHRQGPRPHRCVLHHDGRGRGPGHALAVAGVGRSIDDLERVNGQWLIKSRNVAPTD